MKGCDAHKGSNDSKLLKIKDAGVFRLLGSVVASGAPPLDPGCGLSHPAGQVGR